MLEYAPIAIALAALGISSWSVWHTMQRDKESRWTESAARKADILLTLRTQQNATILARLKLLDYYFNRDKTAENCHDPIIREIDAENRRTLLKTIYELELNELKHDELVADINNASIFSDPIPTPEQRAKLESALGTAKAMLANSRAAEEVIETMKAIDARFRSKLAAKG